MVRIPAPTFISCAVFGICPFWGSEQSQDHNIVKRSAYWGWHRSSLNRYWVTSKWDADRNTKKTLLSWSFRSREEILMKENWSVPCNHLLSHESLKKTGSSSDRMGCGLKRSALEASHSGNYNPHRQRWALLMPVSPRPTTLPGTLPVFNEGVLSEAKKVCSAVFTDEKCWIWKEVCAGGRDGS